MSTNKELLIFDYETTSAKPESARAVQLAAVSLPIVSCELGSPTILLNTLCNPTVDTHHEAAEIHGITDEMIKASGCEVDTFYSAQLYDYIAARPIGDVILGFQNGLTFDYPILMRLAAMHTAVDGIERPYLKGIPYIDTLVVATRCMPNAPNHKLSLTKPEEIEKHGGGGLIQQLGLGSGEGAHDAITDCLMVRDLIDAFMNSLMPGVRSSLAELVLQDRLTLAESEDPCAYTLFALWCRIPRVLKVCHFGKHKGKLWGWIDKEAPKAEKEKYVNAGYARFIAENFDPTPDLVATIRHHYKRGFVKKPRY